MRMHLVLFIRHGVATKDDDQSSIVSAQVLQSKCCQVWLEFTLPFSQPVTGPLLSLQLLSLELIRQGSPTTAAWLESTEDSSPSPDFQQVIRGKRRSQERILRT